jgi:hypothetical protein
MTFPDKPYFSLKYAVTFKNQSGLPPDAPSSHTLFPKAYIPFSLRFCSDHFFYFFLSPQFVLALAFAALAQGAIYSDIGDNDRKAFRVPAPVFLEEQIRIAAMLERLALPFECLSVGQNFNPRPSRTVQIPFK